MELTNEEKNLMLTVARDTLRSLFEEVEIAEPDYEKYPVLKSHAGAFVTLTIQGKLRGCIGYIIGEQPLFQTIRDAAENAAMYDPRFPQLSRNEVDQVHIEISILSEPFPLKNYDEIEIGKHGLILQRGGRRGLLLPQVPVEHKMNRDEYLGAICNKAGFKHDLWKKEELQLDAFTATVFGEE